MKISTKGRYALRMITDLAQQGGDARVSLKDIAERQNVSKKYLEQIVPLLSSSGIVKTTRGNRGGYALAKSPDELTVGEVLRATEGTIAPVSCIEFSENECPRAGECPTLFVWEGLYKTMSDYLEGITIKDIIEHVK